MPTSTVWCGSPHRREPAVFYRSGPSLARSAWQLLAAIKRRGSMRRLPAEGASNTAEHQTTWDLRAVLDRGDHTLTRTGAVGQFGLRQPGGGAGAVDHLGQLQPGFLFLGSGNVLGPARSVAACGTSSASPPAAPGRTRR